MRDIGKEFIFGAASLLSSVARGTFSLKQRRTLVFRFSLNGDVAMDADPFANRPVRICNRHCPHLHVSIYTVATQKPVFENEHRPGFDRFFPLLYRCLDVVWMDGCGPAVVLVLLEGLSGISAPASLFAGHLSLRIIRPHNIAGGSESGTKPFLTLAQRAVSALPDDHFRLQREICSCEFARAA